MKYRLIKTIQVDDFTYIPAGIVFAKGGAHWEGLNPYTNRRVRISQQQLAAWVGEFFEEVGKEASET